MRQLVSKRFRGGQNQQGPLGPDYHDPERMLRPSGPFQLRARALAFGPSRALPRLFPAASASACPPQVDEGPTGGLTDEHLILLRRWPGIAEIGHIVHHRAAIAEFWPSRLLHDWGTVYTTS